jgi:hypothetical protein
MHIKEAIKLLKQEQKKGTENIIFAYWDSSSFDRKDDEDWAIDAEHVESEIDWSRTHELMSDIMSENKEE